MLGAAANLLGLFHMKCTGGDLDTALSPRIYLVKDEQTSKVPIQVHADDVVFISVPVELEVSIFGVCNMVCSEN